MWSEREGVGMNEVQNPEEFWTRPSAFLKGPLQFSLLNLFIKNKLFETPPA